MELSKLFLDPEIKVSIFILNFFDFNCWAVSNQVVFISEKVKRNCLTRKKNNYDLIQ